MLDGRGGCGGRAATRRAGRDRRLRPRPPGRVRARLGRRERSPADPDRHLAGQALPGSAGPARDRWTRRRGARAQWHAARPLLLGGQAGLAARARRGRWPGARRRHPAAGHRGLVPLRSAGRRVRHRSGDRVANAARALPSSTRRCSRSSACRPGRCPRSRTRRATSARCGTTRGRSSCRCGRAAPTSRRRSPGPAAWSRGWRRRPTAPASSCSPTPATSAPGRAAACCRQSPGESVAGSSGRSTVASSPPGPCWSGSAATWDSPMTRRRSPRPRRRCPTRAGCGCYRRSPEWAPPGGDRTRAR